MAFKLPPEVAERLAKLEQMTEDRRIQFANLRDDDLVATARFWMAHCDAPKRVEPGIIVYDSTFWYIIVPELLRRLERK